MKKVFIVLIIFTGICLMLQKKGQAILSKAGTTMEKDNDPNSSTRQMAKARREEDAKFATEKKENQNRLDSDLKNRLMAIGDYPLKIAKDEVAIFLFNDSNRNASFSISQDDTRAKSIAGISVAAHKYSKVVVPAFGTHAIVKHDNGDGTWVLSLSYTMEHSIIKRTEAFGVFYK